ncbi:PaREP1 family protein [Caldivirga sp. MU80]|uniref:PaREP1 family protein n=1 Tax=Caldivirga sp. MU80 TaxID=1650354 RepID=UPI00082B6361
MQASEKLYKAAEESVKAITIALNLPYVEETKKIDRWSTELLFKTVNALVKSFGEDIRNWWHTAWVLHVEGFHEARLGSDHVASTYKHIEAHMISSPP